MAIISPDGLFRGRRLRRCSDSARLYWPYFFLAADGFGRLELDYVSLSARLFLGFTDPPSEEEFWQYISEYRDQHLAFVYRAKGDLWAQWHCKPNCLPRHKTRQDHESPVPPDREFLKWMAAYGTSQVVADSKQLQKFAKNSQNLPKSPPIPIPTPTPSPGKGGPGGNQSLEPFCDALVSVYPAGHNPEPDLTAQMLISRFVDDDSGEFRVSEFQAMLADIRERWVPVFQTGRIPKDLHNFVAKWSPDADIAPPERAESKSDQIRRVVDGAK